MKKTVLTTLIFFITFLLAFTPAVFAADDVQLSATSVTGEVDGEVTVSINIDNALDTEGGQFDLSFDADLVEPKSAARGDFVPDVSGNAFDYNLELEEGKLRVIWVTAEGAEFDSGTVGTITFDLLEEGETNLTFSGIVLAPDGTTAAAPTSGKITVEEAVDPLEAAIDAANKAIADLPDEDDITLLDEDAVKAARDLVDEAKELGAEDDDFEDLDRLEAAEEKIAKLRAIKAADDAILALPDLDELTLDDKPDVVAARALVNKAKDDHGAEDADFLYLNRLKAAENRIKELEGLVPTPPTGGVLWMLPLGLLAIAIGIAAFVRRSRFAVKEL